MGGKKFARVSLTARVNQEKLFASFLFENHRKTPCLQNYGKEAFHAAEKGPNEIASAHQLMKFGWARAARRPFFALIFNDTLKFKKSSCCFHRHIRRKTFFCQIRKMLFRVFWEPEFRNYLQKKITFFVFFCCVFSKSNFIRCSHARLFSANSKNSLGWPNRSRTDVSVSL